MADHEVFEEPNLVLQKGAMLPVARLAYKTVGALNAARDNAVLVPSWYTGTHNDTETYMLGETRALDPRRYFIILTNLLANGLSSSPSNTPAPFERGRFPHVTIYDNVRLQQLLLNSTLGDRTAAAGDRLVDRRVPDLQRNSLTWSALPARSPAQHEQRDSTRCFSSPYGARWNWTRFLTRASMIVRQCAGSGRSPPSMQDGVRLSRSSVPKRGRVTHIN
jgi:hypothetical protein